MSLENIYRYKLLHARFHAQQATQIARRMQDDAASRGIAFQEWVIYEPQILEAMNWVESHSENDLEVANLFAQLASGIGSVWYHRGKQLMDMGLSPEASIGLWSLALKYARLANDIQDQLRYGLEMAEALLDTNRLEGAKKALGQIDDLFTIGQLDWRRELIRVRVDAMSGNEAAALERLDRLASAIPISHVSRPMFLRFAFKASRKLLLYPSARMFGLEIVKIAQSNNDRYTEIGIRTLLADLAQKTGQDDWFDQLSKLLFETQDNRELFTGVREMMVHTLFDAKMYRESKNIASELLGEVRSEDLNSEGKLVLSMMVTLARCSAAQQKWSDAIFYFFHAISMGVKMRVFTPLALAEDFANWPVSAEQLALVARLYQGVGRQSMSDNEIATILDQLRDGLNIPDSQ